MKRLERLWWWFLVAAVLVFVLAIFSTYLGPTGVATADTAVELAVVLCFLALGFGSLGAGRWLRKLGGWREAASLLFYLVGWFFLLASISSLFRFIIHP